MNIFDQYGIKEVADVTLYSIHKKKDGSGDVYYVPALYLDTLKISSVEKTAENVWAQGGLGNARLICWDYGKQINVTLEDALCAPASLGLCWGGILSSNWQDGEIKHDYGISFNERNPVERLSRIEKSFYPKNDREWATISNLLPRLDDEYKKGDAILMRSSIVDGTDVRGFGYVKNHPYKWKMAIESSIKSIAVIPDRFFDINGKWYSINYNKPVEVTTPTYSNDKFSIIYDIDKEKIDNFIEPPAVIILDKTDKSLQDNFKSYQKILKIKGYRLNQTIKEDYYLAINLDNSIKEYNPPNKVFESYWTGKIYNHNGEFINNITIAYSPIYDATAGFPFNNYAKWGTPIEQSLGGLSHFLNRQCTVGYEATEEDSNNFILYWNNESDVEEINNFNAAKYLMIQVDNENNYKAFLSQNKEIWTEEKSIDITQFKNIDMWLRFNSINEQIYFILTKYENDIFKIKSVINTGDMETEYKQIENTSKEAEKNSNSLWSYINPKTMTPYPDDYWFHQGEPYYIKSLTIAPNNKKLKSQKISITAGQFPGMYMMVGETYIRSRDTGEDERMQIKIPLCKIKSDQNITLEAEGEPTVFNMDIEVARPVNGIMMELTSYEIIEKMQVNEQGFIETKDGSTMVLSE